MGIAIVVAIIILISLRDHRMLRRYTYTFGALSLFLLLLPVRPHGRDLRRASVDRLGPVSIQPGELVKVTLACAGYLVTNRDNRDRRQQFLGMRLRARDLGPHHDRLAHRHRDPRSPT